MKVTFTFGDTTKVITIFQKRAVNANPTAIQPLSPSNLAVNTSRLFSLHGLRHQILITTE